MIKFLVRFNTHALEDSDKLRSAYRVIEADTSSGASQVICDTQTDEDGLVGGLYIGVVPQAEGYQRGAGQN